jgi:emp24/gp25L/p24 family/GOLD
VWLENTKPPHDILWENKPGQNNGHFSLTLKEASKFQLCFEHNQDYDLEKVRALKKGNHSAHHNKKDHDQAAMLAEALVDDEVRYGPLPVGFYVRMSPAAPRSLPDTVAGPDAERALRVIDSAVVIQNNWYDLQNHFDFLRQREAVHTHMTSQILNRVMTWTVIEAVLVVGMAVAQVLYWRKFFEQRRYL